MPRINLERKRRNKAEALATTIFDAIRDNVATKADVAAVQADMRAMEQRLDLKFARLQHSLTLGGLGALATGLTALFAALHYWPPHVG